MKILVFLAPCLLLSSCSKWTEKEYRQINGYVEPSPEPTCTPTPEPTPEPTATPKPKPKKKKLPPQTQQQQGMYTDNLSTKCGEICANDFSFVLLKNGDVDCVCK